MHFCYSILEHKHSCERMVASSTPFPYLKLKEDCCTVVIGSLMVPAKRTLDQMASNNWKYVYPQTRHYLTPKQASKDNKKTKEEDCMICFEPATDDVLECIWCDGRVQAKCIKLREEQTRLHIINLQPLCRRLSIYYTGR